ETRKIDREELADMIEEDVEKHIEEHGGDPIDKDLEKVLQSSTGEGEHEEIGCHPLQWTEKKFGKVFHKAPRIEGVDQIV
ncbi:hypothetical protein SK128_027062, partial [Halocaridina rubra]